jgi:hypothetical protein
MEHVSNARFALGPSTADIEKTGKGINDFVVNNCPKHQILLTQNEPKI